MGSLTTFTSHELNNMLDQKTHRIEVAVPTASGHPLFVTVYFS